MSAAHHTQKKRRLRLSRVLTALAILMFLVCLTVYLVGLMPKWKFPFSVFSSQMPNGHTQIAGARGIAILDDTTMCMQEDLSSGNLILVNHEYAYRQTPNVEAIYDHKTEGYAVVDYEVSLNAEAIAALNRMMGDFYAATGKDDVTVISGYRDYNTQESLYQDDLNQTGLSYSMLVSKPGYSEHHTGLALDMGFLESGRSFDGKGAYAWMGEHCSAYGFVVRYKGEKTDLTQIDDEPWHFRYVGLPHAEIMESKGYCLEEYLDFLQTFPADSEHLLATDSQGNRYEIYYTAASPDGTALAVPSDCDYTISGDNMGGFIVTVSLP